MNKYNKKMNTKKILVSFLLIASVLFLAATVSAAEVTQTASIKVDGVEVATFNVADLVTPTDLTGAEVSVNAGDTIDVRVEFTASTNASDVKIRATLEGENDDVTEVTSKFDVIDNMTYVKTLSLTVPSDFEDDELDNTLDLVLEIDDTELDAITVSVQRPSYEVSVKAMVSNTIEAGQSVPVEVVLENTGYNDIEDMYVTVSIAELGIEKRAYFGDLVTVTYGDDPSENDEDAEDTVRGTLNLDVPFTAKSGKYTLVVKVENDEATSTVKKDITISNSISELAIKSGNDLVLINPTNSLKVYKLIYESNEVTVLLPAASTKTVPIEVPKSGDYSFDVSVFSGDVLLSTVKFNGSETTAQITSPVFVLTVILAIVFLVLLVVLIVLITKKPQKAEEFGESYY